MSTNRDNFWTDEDEDDDVQVDYSQMNDSELIKQFRKQLKAEKKARLEAESKLTELSKSQKERAIKDVLTSKGVRQSIAKYIPADIEPTEEAIEGWLSNNAEDFGLQLEQKQQIDASDVNALRQMDRTLEGAGSPASADDLMARMAQHDGSVEDFLSMIRGE
jgi:F0F1-type ATP synthase alpha subunit